MQINELTHIAYHFRLQKLIPSVSIKENVTQLDIILEAIRYIDNLTYKLAVEGEDEAIEET